MDVSWVTPRIGLGSEPSRTDIASMRRQGITDILDLRGEPHQGEYGPQAAMYAGTGITYHYDPMLDRGPPQPASAYQKGVGVFYCVLSDPRRKIFVHCAAGLYRSPSMVYAYLRSTGLSHEIAWGMILVARPAVQPQYLATADNALPTVLRTCPPTKSNGLALGLVVLGAAMTYAGYRYAA